MNNQNKSRSLGRRDFLRTGAITAFSAPLITSFNNTGLFQDSKKKKSSTIKPEWRNRQGGMVYRQLGRTGFMVSEIVFGTERIKPDNIRPLEAALERGVNFFDTAPQYGKGASETAIGKVLSTSSIREKVFLATKLSPLPGYRNSLYREIFDGLPAAKQEAFRKRALELRRNSGIEKPGYFLTYWPNQSRQLDGVFLSDAMMEEYGENVERTPGFNSWGGFTEQGGDGLFCRSSLPARCQQY